MTAEMMDIVHVHVDNVQELQPSVKTEEKEPEHFDCSTIVIPEPTTNIGGGALKAHQIANDPLRKSISIFSIDSPIVVCSSYNQAQDGANQAAGVPFPQGAYVPAGGTVSLDGTGPLWIVATVATASRVSIVANRRS